jgi:hypothetical protein
MPNVVTLRSMILAALAVACCAAEPPDPVEELRSALQQAPNPGDEKATAAYKAELIRRIDALRTPGELARALLLREWDPADPLYQEAQEGLRKLFEGRMRKQLLTGASNT